MLAWGLAVMSFAQRPALSKELADFRDASLKLRESVARKDAEGVNAAVSAYAGLRLTSFDRFKVVDGSQEVPLEGHLVFTPEFADSLLINDLDLAATTIDEAHQLRDFYDCKLVNRAIAPGGKVVYETRGAGRQELLVIAEEGGMLNLYVDGGPDGVKVQDASATGKPVAWVVWKMARLGAYTITIENKSPRAVSFVLAGN